jgi:hypothetical protein
MTGKKHRTAATIAFESCWSSPNQLLKIGANARIGTELAATANGISESCMNRYLAVTMPMTMPAVAPITRPARISRNVYRAAAYSSGRYVTHASAMASGRGRMNCLIPNERTAISHTASRPTSRRVGGPHARMPRVTPAPSPRPPAGVATSAAVIRPNPRR